LVHKDHKAYKDLRGLKEQQDSLVRGELKDCRELKVHKAYKVHKVQLVHKGL
jgi:hypothetical protein